MVLYDCTASSGTATVSSSSTTKVTLGYKPTYVCFIAFKDSTHAYTCSWNQNASASYQINGGKNGVGNGGVATIPDTSANLLIASIDNDGFTITAPAQGYIDAYGSTVHWVAGK